VTLAAVRGLIPSLAALVEFAVYRPYDPKAGSTKSAYGEPRYAVYVVRGRGEVGWRDLGPAKEIDEAISSLRGALRDPKRNDVKEIARAVGAKVMLPLRPLLGDATQLLLSPDGELNLIPFEALIDDQGHYLVEGYSISYLTSGRDLLRMQAKNKSSGKPVVIANPLFGEPAAEFMAKVNSSSRPANGRRGSITTGRDLSEVYFASLAGTAQEAKSIKQLFDASLLTGADATEVAVKQLSAPKVLHLATHGFFLAETPATASGPVSGTATRGINATAKIANPLLRSGLALANANLHNTGNDDGILTALEASGLDLWGTELVVLSGCDTGVGEVRNGEGVYGLRRAFVLAGAESLVMSLWSVSDYTTRDLMSRYYKNLKQNMGRGEALRAVQIDMLKRNPRLHPFFWASFIQSGEWANLAGER
jgi:CHAT domain-containing protein